MKLKEVKHRYQIDNHVWFVIGDKFWDPVWYPCKQAIYKQTQKELRDQMWKILNLNLIEINRSVNHLRTICRNFFHIK